MSDAPRLLVRRAVTLEPGGVLAYEDAAWRDAIVFVDAGEIVLECLRGHMRRFGAGDTLVLAGVPLRCIRNPGEVEARLVAVSRAARIGAWRRRRPTTSPSSPPPDWGSPSSSCGPSPPS